jgi:hypothetical protein
MGMGGYSMASPFRDFLLWLLSREEIKISTVYIEYFYTVHGDSDPIILKFGHKSAFKQGGEDAK